MSESEPSTPEPAESSAGNSPRARRISNPRPKKSAKAQRPEKKAANPSASPPSYPVFDLSESPAQEPKSEPIPGEWPEPEPASAGAASPQEGSKRKRRRKKGKGSSQQNALQSVSADSALVSATGTTPAQSPQPRPARTKADPEKIAKLALKIYLAEVSEEGVALIADNDAKELTRRCFRLAEIFIEEESRRH